MRKVTKKKKHEEEGHISRLCNMLTPMSLSSFFALLTSIKTTGCLVVFPLGKISELTLKPEGRNPGEGVQNGRENPRWIFCPASTTWDVFLYRTAYTVYQMKNIDIRIFFFCSLYKGVNLWSWLRWPLYDGFLLTFFFFSFQERKVCHVTPSRWNTTLIWSTHRLLTYYKLWICVFMFVCVCVSLLDPKMYTWFQSTVPFSVHMCL